LSARAGRKVEPETSGGSVAATRGFDADDATARTPWSDLMKAKDD